ncbi:hypothetical protein ANCCAN_16257, partial [Ancylostoma caninum]
MNGIHSRFTVIIAIQQTRLATKRIQSPFHMGRSRSPRRDRRDRSEERKRKDKKRRRRDGSSDTSESHKLGSILRERSRR